MGGKSKSASSNSTVSTTNDNRIAAEGSIIAAGGSTINYMSDEALDAALNFAEAAFGEAGGLIEQAFDAILKGQEEAFSQIGSSTNSAFEQSQAAMLATRTEEFQGMKEVLSTISLVVVVVAGIYYMGRK